MSEKEIIELVASIEAVKDFTKDFDVIFNFINADDSKDKKIKIKLFKDGGIQIYSKLLAPLDPFLFNIIDNLKDFLKWY